MDATTRNYVLRRLAAGALALVLAAGASPAAAAQASSPAFTDVRPGSTHAVAIAAVADAGIAHGCARDRYCPEGALTRDQMASFLARGFELRATGTSTFTDVSPTSPHLANIQALAESELTRGCSETAFCPRQHVSRAQMATFLARAFDLHPTGRTGAFRDHISAVHEPNVRALADAGITNGCGADRFCGDAPVTRAQFASLLYRAADGDVTTLSASFGNGRGPGNDDVRKGPKPKDPEPSDPDDGTGGDGPEDDQIQPPPDDLSWDPDGEGIHGLLHSSAEVAQWRQRAQAGPYRTAGDVSANSPGDWRRIADNRDRFAASPSHGRWKGPSQGSLTTCVQKGDEHPPTTGPTQLRDAAFHALVTGDTQLVPTIRTELLWQAREAGTDFSNRDRWCTNVIYDLTPSFQISHWLTKYLLAYDYLGPEAFTASERAALDRWFSDAAHFLRVDLDVALNRLYADRGSSLQLSSSYLKNPWCGRVLHLDGAASCSVHRHYNNRRAAIARYVGLVGVAQGDATLRRSAEMFVHEFVAYGVFPDGSFGDFERWTSTNPDLGWAYAANTLAPVLVIADAFARAGDPSLYQFRTTAGAFGSEGGPKDLRFAARAIGRHVDGTYRYYGTNDTARRTEGYRIDGRNESSGWYGVHDVSVVVGNLYHRDGEVRRAYTRTASGAWGYPNRPASNGPHVVWTGDGGIFPGVLFMYGGLEGEVWPY